MQTIVQVICSGRASLREAIVNDKKLEDYGMKVSSQKTPGRNPGWAKIHSTDDDVPGAINLSWDSNANILSCRIIAKSANKPADLAGILVAYLLARFRKRIKAIGVMPD